MSLWKMFN